MYFTTDGKVGGSVGNGVGGVEGALVGGDVGALEGLGVGLVDGCWIKVTIKRAKCGMSISLILITA